MNLPILRENSQVRISRRKRAAFLRALAISGKVAQSARAAGYADSTYLQKLRLSDEEFAQQWDLALESAADDLEDEVIRRAKEGVLEPHYHKGLVVGFTKKYSDQLAMFMLKALRPDKYRETVNVDATLKGKLGIAIIPMTVKDAEAWVAESVRVHNEQVAPIDITADSVELGPPTEIVRK